MKNFYLIQMSRGESIPIDESELPNVLRGIQDKVSVIVKRGIFNPAYYVSIVEDIERRNGWNRQLGSDGRHVTTSKEPLRDLFTDARSELLKITSSQI